MTNAICPPGTAFSHAADSVRSGAQSLDEAASGMVAQLTDSELLWLLDGDFTISGAVKRLFKQGSQARTSPAGEVRRLGIPGIRLSDGPRGAAVIRGTSFPVAIARAATWDPDVERAVGDAIGAEVRVGNANTFAAPCINLAPFPGWGRSQESYGEDPLLLGAMGSALVAGVNPWVLSTVKHFALNSMDEARFQVDVRVAEDVMREVYLPHFRAVIESGADSVMSAYNSVNGDWAGENHHLLNEILREDWGFRGFVHTDWIWGLRSPVESVAAGQDLEMPFRQQRAKTLPSALADGRLARADVVRAATRLVRAQLGLAVRALPQPPAGVVASTEHRALAREVASRGMVLLRNEPVGDSPVLPLDSRTLRRIAVLGRLADEANLGDNGSSGVRPPSTVSILEGLRARLGDSIVTAGRGATPSVATTLAATADVAVVVVGLTPDDEGEALIALDTDAFHILGGVARSRFVAAALSKAFTFSTRWWKFGGDRRDLRLHPDDVALIRAVSAANPRTVVVVVGGGTIVMNPWDREVPSILLAWYPGMEGGHAVADVLLGDAEPTGRLPVTIPERQSDLPSVDWNCRVVTYDRWWGQRLLDRDGVQAAYPFGFGLGYTDFDLSALEVGQVRDEAFDASLIVTNVGVRDGRHVVQVYARLAGSIPTVRVLVGFRSVQVAAGRSVNVTIACSTRPLQRWTSDGFVLDGGDIEVDAAAHAGDPHALRTSLQREQSATIL